MPPLTRPHAKLVLLYALSGAVGLAWQVVQVRAFVPIFGAGAEAIAAVTACFLGGLGIGGALAPRLLRRVPALRAYGLLEIGVGLWGAALPWLLQAAGPLLVTVLQGAGQGAALTATRLMLSAALVGPMAVALGATFPAVAVALDADDRPGQVGLAYGVNAVGAAAGALLAGLWLPWALGLRLGALVLGLSNIGVGGLALWLERRAASSAALSLTTSASPSPSPSPQPRPARRPAPRGVWALAFATGFVGMGLELCWSRVSGPLLAARSGSDAVAFSVVLAAVLLGIGLGGVAARSVRRGLGRPLAIAQGALALLTLLTLEPVREVVLGARHLEIAEGLLPVLPALMLGASFPLLANALAESGTPASRGLGRLYAVNTLGAVAGALLTGFWLMPILGAQRLLVLLAGASAAVALTGWLRAGDQAPAGVWAVVSTVGVVGFFMVTPEVAGVRLIPPYESVFAALEGRQGSTLVSGRPDGGDRALTSGGHRIGAANAWGPANDHVLRAQGPAGLHPDPRRVLLIGLGTGATARAFLDLPSVEQLTVVELDPNMRALLPHFGTDGITDDPRLRLVDGDGRWFVRCDTAEWDVIAVDAYDPRTASATFYTRDFYAEAALRLAEDGLLFVKFNPATVTEPQPLASYLATLWSVFPEGTLVYVQRGLFGVVGAPNRSALAIADTRVVAEADSAAELVAEARHHTDDRPVRIRDKPGARFTFIEPYWEALHGKRIPPWVVRAPRRRR
jgi:spermidine synthase